MGERLRLSVDVALVDFFGGKIEMTKGWIVNNANDADATNDVSKISIIVDPKAGAGFGDGVAGGWRGQCLAGKSLPVYFGGKIDRSIRFPIGSNLNNNTKTLVNDFCPPYSATLNNITR